MGIDSTINKLEKLKLFGMVRALNGAVEAGIHELSNQELLAYITDAEWEYVSFRQACIVEIFLKNLPAYD
jgi:hypothetical protein